MSPKQKRNIHRSALTYSLSVSLAVATQFFGFPLQNEALLIISSLGSVFSIVFFILFILVRRRIEMPKKKIIIEITLQIIVIVSSILYSVFCVKTNKSKFIHNYFFIFIINFILMLIALFYAAYNTKKYIVNAKKDEDGAEISNKENK